MRINRCARCDGLMMYEVLVGGLINEAYDVPCWRCICCGAVVDLVILHNRLRARLLTTSLPRPRKPPLALVQ